MRTRDEVRGGTALEARLKAKTGYSSYKEFTEHEGHSYGYLRDLWSSREHSGLEAEHVTIIELIDTAEPRVTPTFNEFQPSEDQVFDALYTIPSKECLRVIIWHFQDAAEFKLGVFNTIGLILGIDSRFLRAIRALEWRRDGDGERVRPLTAAHAVVGESVVTFGRYDVSKGASVPFVLIAGPTERHLVNFIREETRKHSIPGRSQSCDMLPFPDGIDLQDDEDDDKWWLSVTWLTLYVDLLGGVLAQKDHVSAEKHNLSIAAIFPIIRMHLLRMRYMSRSLLVQLHYGNLFLLYSKRTKVRRCLEETEEAMEHLSRYISLELTPDSLEDPIYQQLQLECREVITQLRRLEAEVRDFMQIESGALAIEETKKSIEIANIQIQEASRVKILTILAFIYVPLNLATSIFGMNLQQLHGTGQPLRTFIQTAVLALVITGASWFCLDQIKSYLIWRRREREKKYNHKPDYSIAVRLAMIFWLVANKQASWMLTSNAWYHILTNSGRRSQGPEYVDLAKAGGREILAAGNFVSKYSVESAFNFKTGGNNLRAFRW